jgi:uncharacterized protein (TIRG00374 family)
MNDFGFRDRIVSRFPSRRALLWTLSFLALGLVAKDFSWLNISRNLSRLDATALVILLTLNFITALSMTARWYLFIRAWGFKVGYMRLVGYRIIGNAVSYVTPGPQFGGEPLQIYLLQQNHQIPPSICAASVALDRVVELLVNVTFVGLGTLLVIHLHAFPFDFHPGFVVAIPVTLLVLTGVLWAFKKDQRPLDRILNALEKRCGLKRWRFWHRLSGFLSLSEMEAAALCRRKPAVIFQAMFCSWLNWGCFLVEYWFIVYFLGVELSILQLVFLATAFRIALWAPLPGGIGAVEAGHVLVMKTFGFQPALGLAICAVIRLRDLVFTLFGTLLLNLWMPTLRRGGPAAS